MLMRDKIHAVSGVTKSCLINASINAKEFCGTKITYTFFLWPNGLQHLIHIV